MEMFGLTLAGYGDYIHEVMREDYREPTDLPNIKEIIEGRLRRDTNKTFNEVYNKLDPILGTADGFSYGSYERLYLQRRKGLVKPVGPTTMYRLAATNGQNFGFWTDDPLLKDSDWMKLAKTYGSRCSEVTKFVIWSTSYLNGYRSSGFHVFASTRRTIHELLGCSQFAGYPRLIRWLVTWHDFRLSDWLTADNGKLINCSPKDRETPSRSTRGRGTQKNAKQ